MSKQMKKHWHDSVFILWSSVILKSAEQTDQETAWVLEMGKMGLDPSLLLAIHMSVIDLITSMGFPLICNK